MQKWIYSCIAMMLFFTSQVSAQDTYADKVAKYVAQYKYLAIEEQQRSGVPAAITLGQGILETEAGCSVLVTGANNHFGIKCKKEWTGETFAHTDDAPDECFRKYSCAADSYKDHSDYLKNSPRYAPLFQLSKTDYPAWALGLKKYGYATNPRYAQQLIKIIEDFKLQEYTYAAMNSDLITLQEKKEILYNDTSDAGDDDTTTNINKIKTDANKAPNVAINTVAAPSPQATDTKGQVMMINGLKAIYGYKGDMLLQYAIKYNVRYEHLLEINDLPDAPLASNMYIYLERKNTKGTHDTHIIKPGESLVQIAQLEGIQLRRLMVLNRLNTGEEPVTGTVLQLQQFAISKPQLMAVSVPTVKKESKIKMQNSDDFITTKKPAETIPVATVNNTAVIEEKEQMITKAAPVVEEKEQAPVRAIPTAAVKQPVMEATNSAAVIGGKEQTTTEITPIIVKEKEQAPTVVTPPAIAKEPELEVAKPVINGPAVNTSIPAPVAPVTVNDDKKIVESKQVPATVPIQNTMPEPKTTAPANDNKKIIESKQAPVIAPAQNTVPEQNTAAPQDDLARLKAELDKVVYTGNEKPPAAAILPVQTTQERNASQSKATSDAKGKYYTVKKGDTAFDIAKQYNITVHQLMEWNDLNFDEITEGKRLRVKE